MNWILCGAVKIVHLLVRITYRSMSLSKAKWKFNRKKLSFEVRFLNEFHQEKTNEIWKKKCLKCWAVKCTSKNYFFFNSIRFLPIEFKITKLKKNCWIFNRFSWNDSINEQMINALKRKVVRKKSYNLSTVPKFICTYLFVDIC